MREKTKKWLLSLAVRFAAAAGIFVIIFSVNWFFPKVTKPLKPIFAESADIQKIGKLLKELAKEVI